MWRYSSYFRAGPLTVSVNQAALAEGGISRDLHVGSEVTILGISLFVLGLGESHFFDASEPNSDDDHTGIGPLFVGPLSEVYGRNNIYRVSFSLFFAFSWPIAFAPDIG